MTPFRGQKKLISHIQIDHKWLKDHPIPFTVVVPQSHRKVILANYPSCAIFVNAEMYTHPPVDICLLLVFTHEDRFIIILGQVSLLDQDAIKQILYLDKQSLLYHLYTKTLLLNSCPNDSGGHETSYELV